MFIISEKVPNGYIATQTNNIRDIYDIILNLTNNEKEALWALETAGDMCFDEHYERAEYKLECVRD